MTLRNPELAADLQRLVDWANGHDEPTLKADAAQTAMADLRDVISELGRIRVAALRQLHETGWSLQEIGSEYGISRQRVDQLING